VYVQASRLKTCATSLLTGFETPRSPVGRGNFHMDKTLFFWGIGALIFFKVTFDGVFGEYRALSISASILLGIMVSVSIYYTRNWYAQIFDKDTVENPSFPFKYLLAMCVVATINVFLAKSIVFGFSKRLNSELGGELLFDGNQLNSTITFVLLVIAPIAAHCISSIIASANLEEMK